MIRNAHKLALAALLLCASAWAEAGTLSVVGQSRWVTVASVFDGDTFRTHSGEKVRLLGINTPEIAHGSQPAQAYGIKAKRRLISLIAGQSVQLQTDIEKRDKYGRTLAHVYSRDGRWINNILVQEGLAQVYTFAPNFRWTDKLLKTEAIARNNMRGLWKASRFKILDASEINPHHIGQFRVIRGYVSSVKKWRFSLGKLRVSIPRKSRRWFTAADMPRKAQKIIIRGSIRISVTGQLYLALHSPFDMK